MFRFPLKGIAEEAFSFLCVRRRMSEYNKDKQANRYVAYEAEYYYKQDKELLEMLKQKTQDEVKNMQEEVQAMHSKIEEYKRDINENLRFLRSLENDLPTSDKKEF
ncbi:hypothetical protein KM043_001134 [Ampulex compressa]|nr:hypothetical protein KM043_001134 [Ampulex compressa]